ncbi:sporulation protein YunB [Paenibacillus tarimensis]|uniref:sporulation protein YunB n=1 Tax=Paenibacillus tarimensis TaxID=416012 RepID=UPI001F248C03|nr:sporulation protein YunB [Paenibacillus tarimensis]MCF2944893.1 sporulation protein YunB [Paenibacillus tarimensis]
MAGWRRKRWRSRRTGRLGGRLGRRKLWLLVMLLMLAFAIQSFIFIERNLKPPLMNVAAIRVKQIATESINKAISEQVAGHSDFEKLVEWKTNGDGKISGFMLNYGEHMRITSETINTVQSMLGELGQVPEHIPVGQALGSAIISSFGPRVPVRFEPVGAVKVDLNTRQTDAGINMILVEVYIRIRAEVAIIIPFDTKPEIVETEIPVSYLLVVGDVPMYYYDNKGNPVGGMGQEPPSIALPVQPPGGAAREPGVSSDHGEGADKTAGTEERAGEDTAE